MNQHCGKHDKIYNEETPCPGCETEKAAAKKEEKEDKKEEE